MTAKSRRRPGSAHNASHRIPFRRRGTGSWSTSRGSVLASDQGNTSLSTPQASAA